MLPKSNGYLAGIFDGEGCVSIATYLQKCKTGYQYRTTQMAISIFQTDERLMKWLMFHYGGRYTLRPSQNKKWKEGWSWSPPSSGLEPFLLSIIPYLLIKRNQALIALEYVRLGKGKPGPNNGNEELQLKRQAFAKRCSELNKRGSPETNTPNTDCESVKIESELMGDHESAPVVTQVA
jgi:hypothetical protein